MQCILIRWTAKNSHLICIILKKVKEHDQAMDILFSRVYLLTKAFSDFADFLSVNAKPARKEKQIAGIFITLSGTVVDGGRFYVGGWSNMRKRLKRLED